MLPQTDWPLKSSTPPSRPCRAQGLPVAPEHSVHLKGHSHAGAVCPWHGTAHSQHRDKRKRATHRSKINEAKKERRRVLKLSAAEDGTRVMSRDAAAALICKLGCLTELLQSRARAKVPTALRKQ